MASSAASLSTPRQVLTSLINRISSIPVDSEQVPRQSRGPTRTAGAQTASNALGHVPEEYRHLIITLHVLFPSLVLPALDLLDRGLITKLTAQPLEPAGRDRRGGNASEEGGEKSGASGGEEDRDGGAKEASAAEENRPQRLPTPLFLVRSAAQASSRRGRKRSSGASAPAAPTGKVYHVRLDAWHCSCAGFAYSAFLDTGPAQGVRRDSDETNDSGAPESNAWGDAAWSFGGRSFDGTRDGLSGDNVPICKHLLACLLAERWDAALGRYVIQRKVTRDEMAGWVADL